MRLLDRLSTLSALSAIMTLMSITSSLWTHLSSFSQCAFTNFHNMIPSLFEVCIWWGQQILDPRRRSTEIRPNEEVIGECLDRHVSFAVRDHNLSFVKSGDVRQDSLTILLFDHIKILCLPFRFATAWGIFCALIYYLCKGFHRPHL